MNAPYMGRFKVSQKFKGAAHDGLDLVGVDSKEIHSTVNGEVVFAGWENPNNHNQGFGQYVKIMRDGSKQGYYFGHLSEIKVSVGDHVKVTQVIGVEGSTGRSTGSHCHYCVRVNGKYQDINAISGIPNVEYATYDDGYRGPVASAEPTAPYTVGTVYKTQVGVNVRTGPGTTYPVKKRSELTADGRRHAYQQTYGVLKPGTSVRCLEVQTVGSDIWIRIPSGWICGIYRGEIYVK